MNIFEYAVEHKLRFPYKGNISTEDLYALSVSDLDTIYKTLKREAKRNGEESLLATKSNDDVALDTKIEIVKYIVENKLAQVEARKTAAANKAKKDKILSILEEKQDAALKNMSEADLRKMLDTL